MPNDKRRPHVLCTSFASLAIVAALTGQTPQTPPPAQVADWTAVHLQKCTVLTRGRAGLETGGINIAYTNLANVAVKQVTFSVVYRGQPVLVRDNGTFSQGVMIAHTFSNVLFGDSYGGPTPEICRVRKVVFANGTVSQAPPLQQEPAL